MNRSIDNEDIVRLFNNMASMLEVKGESVFKIRAYQRAANTIDQLSWSLATAAAAGEDPAKRFPEWARRSATRFRSC